MMTLSERMARLDTMLAGCPDISEIGRSQFYGVQLHEMTCDQLIKVIWLLNRHPAPTSAKVPA